MSIVTVMCKRDIKCRIYEDSISTWVPDLNSGIHRKESKMKVINYFTEIE